METAINAFAKTHGYDTAKKRGMWKGYEVYEPIMGGGGSPCIGLPYYILVKDGKIRMSTHDEVFDIFDSLL